MSQISRCSLDGAGALIRPSSSRHVLKEMVFNISTKTWPLKILKLILLGFIGWMVFFFDALTGAMFSQKLPGAHFTNQISNTSQGPAK